MPGLSSRAIRRAIMLCGSIINSWIGYEIVHDRSRGCDLIGRKHPDRKDVAQAITVSAAMAMIGLKLRAVSA